MFNLVLSLNLTLLSTELSYIKPLSVNFNVCVVPKCNLGPYMDPFYLYASSLAPIEMQSPVLPVCLSQKSSSYRSEYARLPQPQS